jgi:voltage-gated potassium channel Kch
MTGPDSQDEREVVDLRRELRDRHDMSWRERLGGTDRYGVLLVLILVTIVVTVVLRDNDWERLASVTMIGVMLLFALRTSRASMQLQRLAIAFVPVCIVATAIAAGWGDDGQSVRIGIASLMTVLQAAVLLAILRRLATHLTISWNTILGALCIYLLFGMAYSSAYAIGGHAQDGKLFVQQDAFTSADTIYFSLVTLTTVGYGDLTMRTDLTRIMAAMEALLGQIYLITAVGLLIGNLGRRRRKPARFSDAEVSDES